jgi:hypothetical protein
MGLYLFAGYRLVYLSPVERMYSFVGKGKFCFSSPARVQSSLATPNKGWAGSRNHQINHWAWRRAQQVQAFPICVWPSTKHKLRSYVVTYYCTYGLASKGPDLSQLCHYCNARLSPSDRESMVFLKRALMAATKTEQAPGLSLSASGTGSLGSQLVNSSLVSRRSNSDVRIGN